MYCMTYVLHDLSASITYIIALHDTDTKPALDHHNQFGFNPSFHTVINILSVFLLLISEYNIFLTVFLWFTDCIFMRYRIIVYFAAASKRRMRRTKWI
jgi:hypothetical protein